MLLIGKDCQAAIDSRISRNLLSHMTELTSSQSSSMPAVTSTSRFTVSLMPTAIHRRTLQQYSVHFSVETNQWIATINGNVGDLSPDGVRHKSLKFSFLTEREARKFAKSYSPPRMVSPMASECFICSSSFNHRRTPYHCRNCGACICDRCSTRWGILMVPKTYYIHNHSLTVRVCTSCDWLSNAFCMALLQGNTTSALAIQETGNVNLRSTFANINREAMFPVHCAVIGGNLSLLKWLVDTHGCPVSVKTNPRTGRKISVQTSSERSLISLAMTGKPKIDILRYLVLEKSLSVLDTNDPTLAPRTLEVLLRAGVSLDQASSSPTVGNVVNVVEDDYSVSTIEDACILCCEKSMDCVLIPCGHQVCCKECGTHLTNCPVCKVQCSVLRIFRQ